MEIDFEKCPIGSRVEGKVDRLIKLVEKQNGSIKVLQKFMWVCIGGLAVLTYLLKK
jgi:hypothetical protein